MTSAWSSGHRSGLHLGVDEGCDSWPFVSHAGTVTAEQPSKHARRKREQLVEYMLEQLVPHESVQAVIATGSVASGLARAGSDIDAVVFMDPLDLHIAPAESVWRRRDNTYHSTFARDRDGIQLDLHRLDLARWRLPEYVWPEHMRAELADGWIAFDRTGEVGTLIEERTRMSDRERFTILDHVLVAVDAVLPTDVQESWNVLGPAEAFDRLQAGWEDLARGLFALNRKWRPWRSRSLRGLLLLEHLPDALRSAPQNAVCNVDDSAAGYGARAATLLAIQSQLVDQLKRSGDYGADPVSEAFMRLNDEPGRAWNMDEWNEARHVEPT
jgi:predicted nucleotidyltransferase